MQKLAQAILIVGAVLVVTKAHAQQPSSPRPAPPAYGAPISLDQAKAAAAAAQAEAKKKHWNLAIAVVGPSGNLVYFQKADLAPNAAVDIATDKARTSALFRRPSKVFMDRLAKGDTYVLALRGAIPSAGGIPIIVGGKLIGAIGASGAAALQDQEAAIAGAAAIK
jgi:glc operon protein GlcG